MTETIYTNQIARTHRPALSIVTPFHKNDPKLLLEIMAAQSEGLDVELIIVDDGSKDEGLTQIAKERVDRFPAPAMLITFHQNKGRSGARNRLIEEARAPYILFLDSDMAPDSPHFLANWLDLIERQKPEIAYGGYTTLQVPNLPELALARALAERGDCHSAAERTPRGALAVATSNLLVRADIMAEVSFDSDFSGWGWEDVDWALRAQKAGYKVSHVEIPATHMGLDIAPVLLDKFAKAGPNARLIMARHPDMAQTRGSKLAQILGLIPFRGALKAIMGSLAKNEGLPLGLRSWAARMWRALWAA
jgi:glycosyltransferase involved in cell wall biosynthesis